MAGEVGERVVECHELPIRWRYLIEPGVQLGVQSVQLLTVCVRVGLVGRGAGRVDLGQLGDDGGQVVLLDQCRVQPEVWVRLAVDGDRRDPLAEYQPWCRSTG